jgi:transposase-like protein
MQVERFSRQVIRTRFLRPYVTKTHDKMAALAFIKEALKRHGSVETITTDGLRSYGAAMDGLGIRISRRSAAERTTGSRAAICLSEGESCCDFER